MIDVLLAVLLLGYAVTGYRQGLLVSALSLVGFLSGGALAMWLLPQLLQRLERHRRQRPWQHRPAGRRGLRAGLGRAGARRRRPGPGCAGRSGSSRPGSSTRSWARSPALVAVSILVLVRRRGRARRGARAAVPGHRAARASLQAIDRVVPAQTAQLFAGFRALLDREGFPQVFDGVQAEPIPPVASPSPAVTASTGRGRGRGVGRQDHRAGGGPAAAPRRAAAGSSRRAGWSPTRTSSPAWPRRASGSAASGGPTTPRVVVFDPRRDLAVLDVPGLRAPALREGDRRSAAATRRWSPASRRTARTGWTPARVRTVLTRPGRRHLRRARHRARGLLALRAGRAGQLRRPAARPGTAGSSASSSPSRWTTTAPATR